MTWKPWHFIVVAIAGWMNRQQQQVTEYLRTENQVLREKLGHKRVILNESQKVRLAEPTALQTRVFKLLELLPGT
jgi:hypothetical protein